MDEAGKPVAPGETGELLITCLTNYAMPLLRYRIGDCGRLMDESQTGCGPGVQVLDHVSGRSVDVFRRPDRTLVVGEYFTHLMKDYEPWIWKYQVVQKAPTHILFKLVKANGHLPGQVLEQLTSGSRLAMGSDCQVDFEFHDELPPLPSGKFRYTVCEVPDAVSA